MFGTIYISDGAYVIQNRMQNMYMNVGYAKLFSGKLIWKFVGMGKLSFLIAISRFLFNFLSSVYPCFRVI